MNLNLAGKTALITGSSKGIGLSIAKVLHQEGCQVVLNGRDANRLSIATDEISGSIGIVADVTQPAEAEKLISELLKSCGKLDIVVCNVGGGKSVQPGFENADEWQRVFSLNLWSATNTIESAKSALILSKGSVVCISSICGLEAFSGAPVTYSAAKAALNAYIRGIARPLGEKGVRINAIAPGNILFEDSVWAFKLVEKPLMVKDMLEKDVSLRQFGAPMDIANLVAYLVSAKADFVTGAIWTLDGGQVRG